jgi:hypothetical protein
MAQSANDEVTEAPPGRPIVVARNIPEGREAAVEKGLNPNAPQTTYLTPGRMNRIRGMRCSWDDVIWDLHWSELSERDREELRLVMLAGTPPWAK